MSTRRRRLSAVVYSYQRPQELKRCLDSLLAQEERPYEVLVVVKSWDIPTIALVRATPGISLVEVSNPDIGVAVTAGLSAATGELVAFLDDDAVAPSTWVMQLLAHFEDATVGAVGGRDELFLDGSLVPPRPKVRVGSLTAYGVLSGNHHLGTGEARDVDVLKGCNLALRKGLVRGVSPELLGPYTYRWEDDLCFQVKRAGARVVYDPRLRVEHRSTRKTSDRGMDDPALRYLWAFNLTFLLSRHLTGPQRWLWMGFSLLVGQRDDPGILRIPQQRRLWWPGFKGKLDGMRRGRASR